METKDIWKFIFELGHLRRIKHEGWRLIGIESPESVAEHSLRVAQIGYILATLEGYSDPCEVATIGAFHDIEECRIGDLHRVASRYVSGDKERAVMEQTEPLNMLGQKIFKLWSQDERHDTTAGIIAKDADRLEMAAMAKEHLENGHEYARDWLNNIGPTLRTESAKHLFAGLESVHSSEWWQGLKKIQ